MLTAQVLMRRFSKIAKSFAVLLVDARNAFYSLLLEQVSGAADQESALNKVLEKISDLFLNFLGTVLQAAGFRDDFNWHHRSWISVGGVRDKACCSKAR